METYFDHEGLIAYRRSVAFVTWTDSAANEIDAKAAAINHLIRATQEIPLSIATGNRRHSPDDRYRHFELDMALHSNAPHASIYVTSSVCSIRLSLMKGNECSQTL